MQFGAAMYNPNLCRPAAAQLQPSNQLPYNSIVQGLRDALYSTINDLKSLKEENKALKEQVGLQENLKTEVSQLKKELKDKDDLLTKVTIKRRARTKAHVDTMDLLARREKEMKQSNQQWKSRFEALEVSLREELAHSEKSWRRRLEEMEREKSQLSAMWLKKEEDWKKRAGKTDEEIKLLICKMDELQLTLSTKKQLEKAEQLQEEKKKDEKEENEKKEERGKIEKEEEEKMETQEANKMENKDNEMEENAKNKKKNAKKKKKKNRG
ncbi:protein MNN4-like [Thunnus maccoyii]|uniref:protein MNN4-like n=1 Tax=Thunnus maccoyii TaxID=8240 RepID=UPI001C4A9C77|nr:protein MNN4-like [Thunnus maccoyii]